MRFGPWLGAAALAATLAGCGGGARAPSIAAQPTSICLAVVPTSSCGRDAAAGKAGSTSTTTTGTTTATTSATADQQAQDRAAVIASVAFYDMVAGPPRMMALAGGADVISATIGSSRTAACASGSVTVQKTSPTTFELRASACSLLGYDNLVYDGTWLFNITTNTYRADGSCAAGTSCQVQAVIDSSNARFGYGSATQQPAGGFWDQSTHADATRTTNFYIPGQGMTVPGLAQIVINWLDERLTVDLAFGGRIVGLQAADRTTLNVQQPVRAVLTLGVDGVSAAIDANGDGVVDRTLMVDWAAFLSNGSSTATIGTPAVTGTTGSTATPSTPTGTTTTTTSTTSTPTDQQAQDRAAIIASVGFYDMVAGPPRMMALAGGADVISAAVGSSRTAACASGSVTVQKTSATTFELRASACSLLGYDNLVYDGTWRFNITFDTYLADGSCAAGTSCQVQAVIDSSNARFGYGSATEQPAGGFWDQATHADATRTTNFYIPGQGMTVPELGQIVINWLGQRLTVDLASGGRIVDLQAADRTTLNVQLPIRAVLTLGVDGVSAAVDADGHGVVDRTVAVTWAEFL